MGMSGGAQRYDAIVIGAGHNGLACACYLARAGLKVLVLEMAGSIGGCVHTAETIASAPGYRFDTCSVVHNMINMTTVVDELRLREVGLEYIELDPFISAFFPDGACVRFYRSIERTCQELAHSSPEDAETYERFIRLAEPVVELSLEALRDSEDRRSLLRQWGRRSALTLLALWRSRPLVLGEQLASPYGALLQALFRTEYARVGLTALAAHGTLGPHTPGTGFFAFFQYAYHRYGNWHARGGSGALSQALARRLETWGGEVRVSAPVERILAADRVEGVVLANGERVLARQIVAAINPQTALLRLLGADRLPGRLAARLAARHRSNTVQFVVHVALDRLPPWPNAPADAWNGMQVVIDSVEQVRENFVQAEAGLAPTNPGIYLFTSTILDDQLAPPGKHTAYIACPSYPARFADGSTWQERGEREAHRLLEVVEGRAPGFKEAIQGLAWRHAEDWEREIGLLGGHPMHLDITADQVGRLRPLPELGRHRTPIAGLYLSGAGSFPTGGVSAVPGRSAARAVLADLHKRAPRR